MGELKESISVSEAGRRGGSVVKEKYGPEYYSRIGKVGGKACAEKHDMAERGRKGGEAARGKPRQRRLPI